MLNQARIDGLLKYMDQIGLSQMLIRNPVLVRYFVGITPRGADRATILYVSKKNGVKLILNELTNYPKELGVDQEFHGDQDNVAEVISRYTIHDEPLGFDGEYPAKWLLSLREFGAASDYVLGDRALNLQRAHKDAEEMELLREASRMNDRVMARVRGIFHDGITEKEAAGIISRMFVEEGADMPGWVIVAFGPNAANVHHIPGDARLKEGDAILIDMGSPRKGYHSDMTRTFFETLGYENSKKSLVHYPANTYPNQPKALEDNTHFNPYGAYEVAKMVVMGMKQLNLPIVKYLRADWKDFNPAQPDDFNQFVWYPSVNQDVTKPDGN